jgi:hypothetical protein
MDLEVLNRSEDNGRASFGISLWLEEVFEILTLEIYNEQRSNSFSLTLKVSSGHC